MTRDETAEVFALIDYEVQLVFEGIRLTYRLIVPELGQWWDWDGEEKSQNDQHWGKRPYHREATMENIAAAFDVSGYRTGKAHADKPSSGLRANRTSVTSGQHDGAQISPDQQASSQSPSAHLLSHKLMPIDPPNSTISTDRVSGRGRNPKARPRQRPCGQCLRSKRGLMCDVTPNEKRCTRCVRLHLKCKL